MNEINELQLEDALIEMTGEKAEYLNQVSGSFFAAARHESNYEQHSADFIKQGYINKCYFNVSLDINLNADLLKQGKDLKKGTLLKLPGVTKKKRYLIPALFNGLSGRKPAKAENSKVLPALIALLTGVPTFIKFLQMALGIVLKAWEELSKLINESSSDAGKDKVADSFKGDKFLEDKKKEINSQDPANEIDPKKPTDLVQVDPPTGGTAIVNGQEQFVLRDKSGEKGFSLYVQTMDGKWFFVTGTGWQSNLIVPKPGNYGIRIPENAVNVYVMYNQSTSPKLDTGNVWGRFYLYQEE